MPATDTQADEERLVETVNVTAQTDASILIIEAMLLAIGDDADICKEFGCSSGDVQVELKVNGRAVPVVAALADAWKRCSAVIDQQAKKEAVRMVSEAGLEPLAQALRDAEWKIRERLKAWGDDHD